MLKNLGSAAKFVLDTKQTIRSGENIFETIDKLGNSIVHIHISDNGEKGDCLLIGEGTFNINEFLKKLSAKGFNGSVMLELYRENFKNVYDLKNSYDLIKSKIKSL
jgi:sugar phosphate isomerase/epimerase